MTAPRGGPDRLGRAPPPSGALELPVLGVPVRFETDAPVLREAVLHTFGVWRDLPAEHVRATERPVRIRLFLDADPEGDPGLDAGCPPVRYRMPDPDTLVLATPGSTGVADRAAGEATGWLTPVLAAQTGHVTHAVLSALTLFCATVEDRVPVHAAAVQGPGGAALLHGPSGTGKSTLALAASRLGARVLSEDVVFVQLRPTPRIWGAPGPLHVPPESPLLDDDARASGARRVRAAGRVKIAVPPEGDAPDPSPLPPPITVCLLERTAGPPRAEAVSADEVVRALTDAPEEGFDLMDATEVARTLSAGGGVRLALGDDPVDAARLLVELLGGSPGGGPPPVTPRR